MQGTGVHFTLKDKLDIALMLDDMGLDYIEGGFPLSNDVEAAFFERLKKHPFQNAKLCAFGSTRKPHSRADQDPNIRAVLEAETPAVTVVGKTWKDHVLQVLKTSLEENLEMIFDSVSYLTQQGREVIFDLEHFFDGYKDDPDYALQVLQIAHEAGARVLVPCDTNGGVLAEEVAEIYQKICALYPGKIGSHFHNDLNLGVANSLASVREGSIHVQGTINGWGERCGNANLCSIVPILRYKMGFSTNMDSHLKDLTLLSRFVSEKANIIPDRRQPFVGEAAFSHKAGQHADVLLKNKSLMEHMDPALVGNNSQVLLSGLAGKGTIALKMNKFGQFDKSSPVVAEITTILKDKEAQGYEYEAAEASFELLILKVLQKFRPLFDLDNYHLESFKTFDTQSKTVGRIFVTVDGRRYMGAGVGIGPVGVLDAALRNALEPVYPFLNEITLTDFSVRVLNAEESHSEAKVRVFITSSTEEQSWDTVGVSANIVEASWEALVDSFNYYYNFKIRDWEN